MRLKIPSKLAITLMCSCHSGGQHPTDAPPDNVTPITDARPANSDGALTDALAMDAPVMPIDAGMDAAIPPDATILSDAASLPDAAIPPDAAIVADAPIPPDAAIPIDGPPDADLG